MFCIAEYERYLERAYESLESAKILFENGKFNASISQAYYSMFYASKALLSLKKIYPKTHRGDVSMGIVEIKVEVPDGMEKRFRKVIEEIAKFYNRRDRLFELIEELKGSIETDKSWKDLRFEAYEQDTR